MATICTARKKLFLNCLASFDQAAFGYTQGYTQSEQCLLALNELPPEVLGGPQSNAGTGTGVLGLWLLMSSNRSSKNWQLTLFEWLPHFKLCRGGSFQSPIIL